MTSKLKILIREVIRSKVGWDEVLPQPLAEEFKQEFGILVLSGDVLFPRSVKPDGAIGQPEILGFWDGEIQLSVAVYMCAISLTCRDPRGRLTP